MFSVREKRAISDAVQIILRNTNHPELPKDEISFTLCVKGAAPPSYANIENNRSITTKDEEISECLQQPFNEAKMPKIKLQYKTMRAWNTKNELVSIAIEMSKKEAEDFLKRLREYTAAISISFPLDKEETILEKRPNLMLGFCTEYTTSCVRIYGLSWDSKHDGVFPLDSKVIEFLQKEGIETKK